ncbi:MAG: polysaccharide deacetylase family protein [Acidimicrobiia bacterium]|nr:polysaccharide deacetylase family protein [Acidimicrobiia bacterium]
MRVIAYHGVVEPDEQSNHFARLFTDVESFEQQATLLARRGRLVTLEELEAALTDGHRLPDDAIHVSFDDGFANNLRVAEILDRHRIPWSLFVVVDSVLDGYRPWFVRLADAIEATSNVMLLDGSVFEMSEPARKREFAQRVKVQVMAAMAEDHEDVVDRVLALPGMSVPRETSWPMLEVRDLKELAAAGVAIGNHSARHRNLPRCDDHLLATEVAEPRPAAGCARPPRPLVRLSGRAPRPAGAPRGR